MALLAAASIFAGGLLQTLFAIAAWPLQRYRPERLALAGALHGLDDFARATVTPGATVTFPPSLNNLQTLLFGAGRAHGRATEAFRVLAGNWPSASASHAALARRPTARRRRSRAAAQG